MYSFQWKFFKYFIFAELSQIIMMFHEHVLKVFSYIKMSWLMENINFL